MPIVAIGVFLIDRFSPEILLFYDPEKLTLN